MGKVVIVGIFVLAGLMGSVLYFTMKGASGLRDGVTEKLHSNLVAYVQQVQNENKISVESWKFDLVEKKIIATLPRPVSPETEESLRLKATEVLTSFLRTQFPKEKEFEIQIQFL